MKHSINFAILIALGLCLLAFIMACFGAFGTNIQQLIADIVLDSRTHYVRIR